MRNPPPPSTSVQPPPHLAASSPLEPIATIFPPRTPTASAPGTGGSAKRTTWATTQSRSAAVASTEPVFPGGSIPPQEASAVARSQAERDEDMAVLRAAVRRSLGVHSSPPTVAPKLDRRTSAQRTP